jgi:hypothetical protein
LPFSFAVSLLVVGVSYDDVSRTTSSSRRSRARRKKNPPKRECAVVRPLLRELVNRDMLLASAAIWSDNAPTFWIARITWLVEYA